MRTSCRLLLLLFFLLYNFGISFSQATFGVKAGMNLSKGEFKPYEGQSLNFIINYHVGVLAEFDVYKRFYLQPELLYSNKGWNVDGTYSNKGTDVHLHYLNMPMLAGYRFNKYASMVIGPEFGYLLKAENNPGGKIGDIYQKYDLGISLGTSFNFASGFGVEFRYTHGFKGLLRNVAMTDQYGDATFHIDKVGSNRLLQISTRYRFTKL